MRAHRVLATDRLAVVQVQDGLWHADGTYRQLGVTSGEDWAASVDWVQQSWGGLYVVVNNAGIAAGGRIELSTMAEWRQVLDINLLGVVRGCRAAVELMLPQGGGVIVNVASLAGLIHGPSMACLLYTSRCV